VALPAAAWLLAPGDAAGRMVEAADVAVTTQAATRSPGRASPRAKATKSPKVTVADIKTIRAAIEARGASAVLVNVWATWCEPCREEMPGLVRFFQKNRDRGLRLVLVSADSRSQRHQAAAFLAKHGVDIPSFLKTGDDQAFIDGIDKAWGGTMPVSILYDGTGAKRQMWDGVATEAELQSGLDKLLATKTEGGEVAPPPRSHPPKQP
jgi:thiol-disulfide isomerase/thioredoxin